MKITLPLEGDVLPVPPVKDDGGLFPFLLLHGDSATFADSNTELVAELIDGYAALDDSEEGNDAALTMRYDQAVSVATAAQSGQLIQATKAGDFDAGTVSEEALNALMVERTVPFTGIFDAEGALTTEWTHKVPLVLIDVDYAPFSQRTRPTGNIIWISPSVETAYLSSLDAAGVVVYVVAADALVTEDRPEVGVAE